MQLDSYLELFTTMYGWAFANIIGELITGTGLVILPFAIIIFQGWREAKEQGMQSAGVLPLIESVQTKLIIALFVLALCFATTPITSLVNARLSYTPAPSVLNPSPETGTTAGGAGSYTQAMKDATDGSMSDVGNLSYVPLWWYSVMAVSSGINNAIRQGLRNSGNDMRMVDDMAQMATIEDPKVLSAAQAFYNQCFIPARSRYLAKNRPDLTASGQAIVDPANKEAGPSDVDWMGSTLFRSEPGFYADMRAANPVAGFPVNYARDTDYYNPASGAEPPRPGVINPDWGRPTCKEWWEDSSSGVREALIGHSEWWRKMVDSAGHVFNWRSTEETKDGYAKLAQTKANLQFVDSDQIMGEKYGLGTQLARGLGGYVSTIGVTGLAAVAGVTMTPLLTGLPMLQALVLMALYMFIPLIVFLSGFSLRAMFYGAVAIFTVKMWAGMWVIAQWVDAHLIAAMYPGGMGAMALGDVVKLVTAQAGGGVGDFHLYKRMLLNILMLSMFVGLPMIWTAMMGWIGLRVGGQLTDMAKQTEGHSRSAAGTSTAVATKGKVR